MKIAFSNMSDVYKNNVTLMKCNTAEKDIKKMSKLKIWQNKVKTDKNLSQLKKILNPTNENKAKNYKNDAKT